MLDMIRPAGLATAGRREAKKGDAFGTRPSNSQNKRTVQAAIRAELAGSDTCTAPGITARAPSPILEMTVEGTDLEGGRAMTTPRNSRAAAVAVAVIQIIKTALRQQRQQQVEQYLRDEFEDERREALVDQELTDA